MSGKNNVYRVRRGDLNMGAAWLLGPTAWAGTMALWSGELQWPILAGALLILPILLLVKRLVSVRTADDALHLHNTWGRPQRVAWDQLAAAEFRRTVNGRVLRLTSRDGGYVQIPGNLDGIEELAATVAARCPNPAAAAGLDGCGCVIRRTVGAAAALLLMAGWAAALAWGLWRFAHDGEMLELVSAALAGVVVPGLAFLMVRSRPGGLAQCWPAAQLCLWALIPALVWSMTAAQPLTVFSLLGWMTVAYAAAAALSVLLPRPGPSSGAAAHLVPGLAVLAFSAAGAGAWWYCEREVALRPEPLGVFNFRELIPGGDGDNLPLLAEAPSGRWFTFSSLRMWSDKPVKGGDVVAVLGRAPVAEIGTQEVIQEDIVNGTQPPRLGLWNGNGSAVAVLCGTGGSTRDSLRITEAKLLWWDNIGAPRTSRTFERSVEGGYPFRGAAWAPDGRRLALHLGKSRVERRIPGNPSPQIVDTPARVFLLLPGGGDRGGADITLDEDMRLTAWRPDGKLVFEWTDDKGVLRADYRDPSAPEPASGSSASAPVPEPEPLVKPKRPAVGPHPEEPRPAPPAPRATVRKPARPGVEIKLPGRQLARSPEGRFLIFWEPEQRFFAVWDHWKAERLADIPAPEAAETFRGLGPAVEAAATWSGDRTTALLPPIAGGRRVVVLSPAAGRVRVLDLSVSGAASNFRLSHDGRRFAFLAAAGSLRELVRPLRDAVRSAFGGRDDEDSPDAAGRRRPAVPEPGAEAASLQRAVFIADVADGALRRVALLPAGRESDPAGETPAFHWPSDESAVYVTLTRPRTTEMVRQVFRVALPE